LFEYRISECWGFAEIPAINKMSKQTNKNKGGNFIVQIARTPQKILSLVLAVLLILTCFNFTAFAAEESYLPETYERAEVDSDGVTDSSITGANSETSSYLDSSTEDAVSPETPQEQNVDGADTVNESTPPDGTIVNASDAALQETPAPTGPFESGNERVDDPVFTLMMTEAAGGYQPGAYTGTATGYGGPLSLTVEINDSGVIDSVVIGENSETPARLAIAGGVIAQILQNQSVDGVDAP
jgi:uncharacterized protein with FMN-binding domain